MSWLRLSLLSSSLPLLCIVSAHVKPTFDSSSKLDGFSSLSNVDGNTSAPRNNVIPPAAYKAIVDQDSKTSFVKPTRTFLSKIITIGDLALKYNSASQYLLGDKTLAPGLPAITISGTPISLGPYPASQIIIGSSTIPVWISPTPPHPYTTPWLNSVVKGHPSPDMPAASATLEHLPHLSRPAFSTNPAGYTRINRSSTETSGYLPGVAILPTGQARPSSKGSTPIPLPPNAAVRMKSGAWELLVSAFGLGTCLWWM